MTPKIIQKENPILRMQAQEVPMAEITSKKIRKVIADMKKQLEDVQRSMREHTEAIQKEARESVNFVGTELQEISHETTKDLPKS